MKLLGCTKKDVDKDKEGEDALKPESAEVFLIHLNLVNNSYQQASKILLLLYLVNAFVNYFT